MSHRVAGYLRYTVYPQLDVFDGEAVPRLLSGFSDINAEAEGYANRMYESYKATPGEGDLGDLLKKLGIKALTIT